MGRRYKMPQDASKTRINLYIEGDLHTELSARAAKERRTLNEVMAQAIREYMERHK